MKGLLKGTLVPVSVASVLTFCASGRKGNLRADSFGFSALSNIALQSDLTGAINVTVEPEVVLLSHPDDIAPAT